tara:strand:- start:3038 stop:3295 length:258 start_codon:yes stop_codon:yes gene_type:complete
MFDIKNEKTFLGGQNVHNLLILGALGFIIYKQMEMQKKFASLEGDMSEFSNAGGECPAPLEWCARLGKCLSPAADCHIKDQRKRM